MSLIETIIDVPAEHERKVCGQFDCYLKKIERTLHVYHDRQGRGAQDHWSGPRRCRRPKACSHTLIELSKRGERGRGAERGLCPGPFLRWEATKPLLEIDKDIICRTINGKPVKPKTLGQKQYVDLIRKKMIVFGVGPAGTGKTYLGMAMAIQAFKNGEVNRIILTTPGHRGRREAGLPAGRLAEQDRSVSAAPVRRPVSDHGRRDAICTTRKRG